VVDSAHTPLVVAAHTLVHVADHTLFVQGDANTDAKPSRTPVVVVVDNKVVGNLGDSLRMRGVGIGDPNDFCRLGGLSF
jgi:hypothetical protein